ncbi:hypothetical protein F5Y08DRAFT_18098 [Xylaria arbuscula]|nr:hypothetical protein F5Y08DRAFT_18098 [Xylaria arbuscula]
MHSTLYTTWEDAEVWNGANPENRDGQQQTGVFMCNRYFGLLLLVAFVMCVCVQLVRVNARRRREDWRSHTNISDDIAYDTNAILNTIRSRDDLLYTIGEDRENCARIPVEARRTCRVKSAH